MIGFFTFVAIERLFIVIDGDFGGRGGGDGDGDGDGDFDCNDFVAHIPTWSIDNVEDTVDDDDDDDVTMMKKNNKNK